MVVGDFSSSPVGLSELTVRVTSPMQTTLFSKAACQDGKFAFTAPVQGEYTFCFENLGMSQKTIKFDLKTGVHAKDYSAVAKKDHLKPIEVELRRLEDMVQSVHEDMSYLRTREEEMRNTNGARIALVLTAFRINLFFCLLLCSLHAIISSCCWVVLDLRFSCVVSFSCTSQCVLSNPRLPLARSRFD